MAQTVFDAQVPQDFDGSLIGDVGARRISRAAIFRDGDRVYASPSQEGGRGESGRAGANDEYVRFDQFHGSSLRSPKTAFSGALAHRFPDMVAGPNAASFLVLAEAS